jgi:hypothetical protein
VSIEPNYPVIELQTENLRLKDELIGVLKRRVDDLERELEYLRNILRGEPEEADVGSNMIAPSFPLKSRFRTMSEVAKALEARSLNASKGKLSAEDISNEG